MVGGWWRRRYTFIDVFIFTVIVLGIAIPMLYVQTGTSWNSLQFFYYSLVFLGILTGVVLGEWLGKNKKSYFSGIAMGVVVLLTIPTTVGTLGQYLPARPPAKISNDELDALDFLSKQPDGVVLTLPFDREAAQRAQDNPPRPLYLYESTAYVSALSDKQAYLEDEVNLDITGYDWRDRRENVEVFLLTQDGKDGEFLRVSGISYLYFVKSQEPKVNWEVVGVERIFENSEIEIYKVNN